MALHAQGAYRDDAGKPVVLDVVREAEARVAGSNFMEYLPIAGLKAFNDLSVRLAYGDDAAAIAEGRVAAVQSLSGTGAALSCHHCTPAAGISPCILDLARREPVLRTHRKREHCF